MDTAIARPNLEKYGDQHFVFMVTNDGLSVVKPATGETVGKHDWKYEGYRVTQPLVFDEVNVLFGTPMGQGSQLLMSKYEDGKFTFETKWQERSMSPYYNDNVVHKGYLYGFDNNIFACVDIADGKRQWKRGRYGNGQVLLLPKGDQLLVISEKGELVLLRATPDKLTELARHQAVEGRTWNHPVLIGNQLYVRNATEAVCFEVATTWEAPAPPEPPAKETAAEPSEAEDTTAN